MNQSAGPCSRFPAATGNRPPVQTPPRGHNGAVALKNRRKEIIEIAVSAVRVIKECSKNQGKIQLGIHAGSFTATEPDFCVGNLQCGVVEEWENRRCRSSLNPGIHCLPFAAARLCQSGESISVPICTMGAGHSFRCTHNDRGSCREAELGFGWRAAGGKGPCLAMEHTGNVDLVTFTGAQPVFPPRSRPAAGPFRPAKGRTDVRGIHRYAISPRHPYGGELVFAAFSGSHQDAIAKRLFR